MKTLIATLVIATSSTAAVAHTCGIANEAIVDYPGYAVDGPVYDRGTYLFTTDTERQSNGDSITSHVRINKSDCTVSVINVLSKADNDVPVVTVADGRVVTNKTKYTKRNKTMVIRDITVTKDGATIEITRRVVKNNNGSKVVTVDNHTNQTAVQRKFKRDGSLRSQSQVTYKQDRNVGRNWSISN